MPLLPAKKKKTAQIYTINIVFLYRNSCPLRNFREFTLKPSFKSDISNII